MVASKSHLTVASAAPAEPPKPRRRTVAAAAATGDRRELLLALRGHIAATVTNGCPPRNLAALTLRLVDITKTVEEMDRSTAEDQIVATTRDETFDGSAI